jgi:hypothetical protein
MNFSPAQLLGFLIENGRTWVRSQRDRHRLGGRTLTPAERAALRPFFEERILDSARIVSVPVISNPDFYAGLAALGVPPPLDFTVMAGITFIDTILVSDREHLASDPLELLLFHELVHVVQYDLLGTDVFVEQYVRGWAENGQDYFAIPLERDAYELQNRFVQRRANGFSVKTEVCRQLGFA